MTETEFQIGDRVRKRKGYKMPGTVYMKGVIPHGPRKGKTSYAICCDVPEVEGICHIFTAEDLENE